MSDQDATSPPATAGSNPGTPAPTAFKPRAGVQRQTKAAREKFLKEEAEREAKRVKEAAKNAGTAATAGTRGGRGGARGRGGAAAQTDTRLRSGGESGGVFGSGSGSRPATRARGNLGAGNDELLEWNGILKDSETGKDHNKADAVPAKGKKQVAIPEPKSEEPRNDPVVSSKPAEVPIEVDEEPDEARRDIERIWISSEEEEDDDDLLSKGKEKARSRSARPAGGLRPVRAPRTLKDDDDDTELTRVKTPAKTAKRPATEPIDIDEMDVDEPEFIREAPSSPETKKKNLKKPTSKPKDVKFATETPEERTERLRVAEDTSTLRNIFTSDKHVKPDTDDLPLPAGNGKLFLLQFPPLTPLLIDPNAPNEIDDEVIEVKQEGAAAIPPAPTPSDAKGKGPAIKKDPDVSATNKKPPLIPPKTKDPHNHNGVFAACCPPNRLPTGLVGKLNVHASGKITLDWGGTDMEVRLGTEVDFLQDAVLVKTKKDDGGVEMDGVMDAGEDDDEGAAAPKSTAYALGQVEGKMVVIPDWSRLYD